jgi:hypothetical protein
MKRLLLLALVSMPALAQMPEIMATMPNRDNSKITFTTIRGSCDEGERLNYAQGDGGKIMFLGCYRLVGDQVFVRWADGDVYTYDWENLTLTKEFLDYLGKRRK